MYSAPTLLASAGVAGVGIEAQGLSALDLGESHQRAMFPDGALDRCCPGALGTDARAEDQQAESRLLSDSNHPGWERSIAV